MLDPHVHVVSGTPTLVQRPHVEGSSAEKNAKESRFGDPTWRVMDVTWQLTIRLQVPLNQGEKPNVV